MGEKTSHVVIEIVSQLTMQDKWGSMHDAGREESHEGYFRKKRRSY
jgi:hypothetical protein